jgi:hypothetical protein
MMRRKFERWFNVRDESNLNRMTPQGTASCNVSLTMALAAEAARMLGKAAWHRPFDIFFGPRLVRRFEVPRQLPQSKRTLVPEAGLE